MIRLRSIFAGTMPGSSISTIRNAAAEAIMRRMRRRDNGEERVAGSCMV